MKRYLGDSVYVDVVGGMLLLTTENGLRPSNSIFLEPSVYAALTEYVEELRTKEEPEDDE
jgi:hypothetical protein